MTPHNIEEIQIGDTFYGGCNFNDPRTPGTPKTYFTFEVCEIEIRRPNSERGQSGIWGTIRYYSPDKKDVLTRTKRSDEVWISTFEQHIHPTTPWGDFEGKSSDKTEAYENLEGVKERYEKRMIEESALDRENLIEDTRQIIDHLAARWEKGLGSTDAGVSPTDQQIGEVRGLLEEALKKCEIF